MPPFVYSPVDYPYVNSIAQLMTRGGDIQAEAARDIGAAQAQGIRGAGQAWGQGLQNVGQDVAQLGQIPAQIQQQKFRGLQMQDIQGQIAERNARAAQMKREADAQDAWSSALKTNLKDDGTPDEDKAAEAVSRAGFPVQANTFLEARQRTRQTSLALQAEAQKIKDSQRNAQQHMTDGFAELGSLGLEKLKTEDPLSARDHMMGLAAAAGANGFAREEDIRNFLMQSAQAGPEQLQAIYQHVLDQSPTVSKRVSDEAIANALKKSETTKNLAEAARAARPEKPDEWQAWMQTYPGMLGKPNVPWNALTPQEQAQGFGAFAQNKADPAMRALAMSMKQMEINQQPTKEDAAGFAKQLVEHKMAPSQVQLFGGFGTAGAAFKRMIGAEALKLDPSFNWEQAESDYQFGKSSGFQNSIRYMDAVTESIPRLEQNLSKLANGKFRTLNAVVNAGKQEFNSADVKAFKTDAMLVGDEVAKIIKGGGTGNPVTDAALAQAQSLFSTSDDVPAMAAAVKEVQFLVGNRRSALTRGTYLEGSKAGGSQAGTGQPVKVGGFTVVERP